jgi:hypothetical protein
MSRDIRGGQPGRAAPGESHIELVRCELARRGIVPEGNDLIKRSW